MQTPVCASVELPVFEIPVYFPASSQVYERVGFSSGFATGEEPVMAESSMEVDPTHLHAGAERCSDAAEAALAAAGKLAGKKPAAGMFGDFAEADEFHGAVSAAHQSHVEQLHDHHRALNDVGDKSRSAATEFTAQDASAADSLRATESGFGTR
jgi:Protein of unknown function (DUF2563)